LDAVIAAEDTQLATESGEEVVGLRLAMTQLPDEYRVPW